MMNKQLNYLILEFNDEPNQLKFLNNTFLIRIND
jgi:hypothetical protein